MLKPSTCANCSLYSLGNSFSRPEGKGRNGVLLLGEALGHDEAIEGLPFRPKAQAGSKLEECIKANGYRREDFLLWNIIACQPPGNKLLGQWYTSRAIAHCKQYLEKVLDDWDKTILPGKNKVILALGNTAYQAITGRSDSVLDIRGFPFDGVINGIVYTVIPTLHPSYIKRGNGHLTPLLIADMQKSVEIAGGVYFTKRSIQEIEMEKAKRVRAELCTFLN